MGNLLGGKKAAMQFVHQSIYGKSKLVDISPDLEEGSREDDGETGKESSFDDLWKLSEELKTLQAALESLQGKEIQPVKVRGVQVQKEYDGGNLANNENGVGENRSQHVDEETEAANDALGEVSSDAGAKLVVQEEPGSRRLDVDDKLSMPRS